MALKAGYVFKINLPLPLLLEGFVGPGIRDVNITYLDVVNKQKQCLGFGHFFLLGTNILKGIS